MIKAILISALILATLVLGFIVIVGISIANRAFGTRYLDILRQIIITILDR